MAFTQSDIDALDLAIKKGVLRVRYLSGEVEYQSLSEMLKLREVMKSEVADPDGTAGGAVYAGRIAS